MSVLGQSLNLLSSILTILLTCPNSDTLVCYSNDPVYKGHLCDSIQKHVSVPARSHHFSYSNVTEPLSVHVLALKDSVSETRNLNQNIILNVTLVILQIQRSTSSGILVSRFGLLSCVPASPHPCRAGLSHILGPAMGIHITRVGLLSCVSTYIVPRKARSG